MNVRQNERRWHYDWVKKLFSILSCLLLIGCGEKKESGISTAEATDSSVDSQAAGNRTEESSADIAKAPPAELPVIELPSEESSDTPKSLSDADVERLVKEAVDSDSLEERDGLFYQNNEPFSGWVKSRYDSGQVQGLGHLIDGKPDGLQTGRYENGQKMREGTFKSGNPDGLWAMWHENGQKLAEGTYKDGEEVSAKYWNRNGEEVKTWEEATEVEAREEDEE